MGSGRPGALDAGANQADPNFVWHVASSWEFTYSLGVSLRRA
jgi:hypothetical protein